MSIPGIKSLLKIGIDELPDTTMTGAQAKGQILNRGVKQDELKFSGFDEAIKPDEKYTKQQLQEIEANRVDEFDAVDAGREYDEHTMPGTEVNPLYREVVYTYKETAGKPKARQAKDDAKKYQEIFKTAPVGDESRNEAFKEMFAKYPGAEAELNSDAISTMEPERLEKTLSNLAKYDYNSVKLGMDAYTGSETEAIRETARRGLEESLGTMLTTIDLQQAKGPLDLMAIAASKEENTKSRFTDVHFPDVPNYLFHARTAPSKIYGKMTHVVQELQSTLLQKQRHTKSVQAEKSSFTLTEAEKADVINLRDNHSTMSNDELGNAHDRINTLADLHGFDFADMENHDPVSYLLAGKVVSSLPDSPFETHWVSRGIERELQFAFDNGLSQLAVPIRGAHTEGLKRGVAPQRYYDTVVRTNMKKVADKHGLIYEEITEPRDDRILSKFQEVDKDYVVNLRDFYELATYKNTSSADMLTSARQIAKTLDIINVSEVQALVSSAKAASSKSEFIKTFARSKGVVEAKQHLRSVGFILEELRAAKTEADKADAMRRLKDIATQTNIPEDTLLKTATYDDILDAMKADEAGTVYGIIKQPGEGLIPISERKLVEEKAAAGDLDAKKLLSRDEGVDYIADYYTATGARELAHKAKQGDVDAIKTMAAQMVDTLPSNVTVVPVPSSTGRATVNKQLAEELKLLRPDINIVDVVKGDARESLYDKKKANKQVDSKFFNYRLIGKQPGENTVLLDTVYATGQTTNEIKKLLPLSNPKVVTYARDNTAVPAKQKRNFDPKLYSTASGTVLGVYVAAKEQGRDPKDVLREEGYTGAQYSGMVKELDFIMRAEERGASIEQIARVLKKKDIEVKEPQEIEDPSYLEKATKAWNDLREDTAQWSAQNRMRMGESTAAELFADLQTVYPNESTVTARMRSVAGNKELQARNVELNKITAKNIVNQAAKHGLTLRYYPPKDAANIGITDAMFDAGKYYQEISQAEFQQGKSTPNADEYVQDSKDGAFMREMTLGFMQEIAKEKNELAGTLAGAFGGGAYGGRLAAQYFKHPLAIAGGVAGGSIIGAVTGAVGGTEIDYLMSSITVQQELDARIMSHKGLTAAEASAYGDFTGVLIHRFGVKPGVAGWKYARKAFDAMWASNTKGAKDMLLKYMFISEEEADILINSVRRVTDDKDVKLKRAKLYDWEGKEIGAFDKYSSNMNKDEEMLRDMVLTQPSGEHLIRAAASLDPQAARSAARAVDNRAQDLLATSGSKAGAEDIGKVLRDDFENYQTDVKRLYSDTKSTLVNHPNVTSVKFNYDKIAVQPLLDRLATNITDPTVEFRFLKQAEQIQAMSSSRTMADLIELRQLVNDFSFNKRITKQADKEALRAVIASIDASLEQGVNQVMGKADAEIWLANWSEAKAAYAKMSNVKKNTLAKLLVRPGVTDEMIGKALVKHINDIDGTFNDVMEVLPKQARVRAEWSVLDQLSNKWADGSQGGWKAIHFPALAEDLDKIAFTDPEARKFKAAVLDLADVFKNDIYIADASGQISLPKFQSYLTTDPVVRAQFELATSVFNWAKKRMPTEEGRKVALVTKTAELLRNPLNAKSMKELMQLAGNNTAITQQAIAYQQQLARASAKTADNKGAIGKFFDDGDGLLTTANKTQSNVESIPLHRIATYEKRLATAQKYGLDQHNYAAIDRALRREGFIAVQQGSNKIRRLK